MRSGKARCLTLLSKKQTEEIFEKWQPEMQRLKSIDVFNKMSLHLTNAKNVKETLDYIELLQKTDNYFVETLKRRKL